MQPTIGICDPLPVFRGGLRNALSQASFLVDEPVDILEWARRCEDPHSELGVVLSLTTRSDWLVLDQLHEQQAEVAVVTLLHQPTADGYRDALARGALSAAPRAGAITDIVEVVRAAVQRQTLLPASVSRALASGRPAATASTSPLGEEERSWLRELASGVSVEDLAWRLGYSRRTMYRRLSNVYRRLGASRREGALLTAVREGVI